MKKNISIVIMIFLIVTTIVGCEAKVEMFTLEGTYLTFENGGHMIIDKDNGPITMRNETGDEDIFDDLTSGDKIKVEVDLIAESYPGQTTIYDLEFIEEGTVDEISEKIMKDLIEMGWVIK